MEEFFGWADGQEGRYEFDGFEPIDMNGGTVNHAIIIQNLGSALRSRLRTGSCRALGPGAGVATIDQAVRYPDALVTCDKLDGKARIVSGVVVVFEVLSPSTSRNDRIDKVREYAVIPSVRRYVILECTSIGATVMERFGAHEAWRAATHRDGDVLHMPEIGIEIPLTELYDEVEFDSAIVAANEITKR